ncbi:30S ribosomal protein S11 [Candidatus Parcubacteria bacterium]|nr:30S ribosomal protein S11 [Candidatus Parcubacteria bacterium]
MGKKKVITQSGGSSSKEKIESKIRKVMEKGTRIKDAIVYISCSYNNTIISLTDMKGNVLHWATAGNIGFKGTRKGTPFAATKVAETIASLAEKKGIEKIIIRLRGIGTGRDSAVRALAARTFEVVAIEDLTSVPHNGCRPKKSRRV